MWRSFRDDPIAPPRHAGRPLADPSPLRVVSVDGLAFGRRWTGSSAPAAKIDPLVLAHDAYGSKPGGDANCVKEAPPFVLSVRWNVSSSHNTRSGSSVRAGSGGRPSIASQGVIKIAERGHLHSNVAKTHLLMKRGLGFAAAAAVVCAARSVRADSPVVVAYTAPPECASAEAFHALLAAEISRTPNADRPWRFSITIRHEGDYVGTLETEMSTRELRAPTCDDVTAALALVIATAEPSLPPPPRSAPPPPPPPPAPPRAIAAPSAVEPDRGPPPTREKAAWRLGVRFQNWSKENPLTTNGATVVASVEPVWGRYRMMLEAGVGVFYTQYLGTVWDATDPSEPIRAYWAVVDTQVCPLDVAVGKTGLSLLGCGRLGAGMVQLKNYAGADPLMGWAGAGGRLRWQSPWAFYVEAQPAVSR